MLSLKISMLKKVNRLNDVRSFLRAFSTINGIFIVEINFLMYFFEVNAKNVISELGNSGLIISAIIWLVVNSLIFSKIVRSFLKKIQYSLLIEVISYFIVYTIALIVINSEIGWNIDKFGIFILSLVLDLIVIIWAQYINKDNILSLIVLLLSILCILLISSLSVAIFIHDFGKCNILYLICSLVVFGLLFLSIFLNKKFNINAYLIKGVHIQVIDIILSFVFIIFILLLAAATLKGVVNEKSIREQFDNWVPLLSISIAMGLVGLLYYKKLKMHVSKLFKYYFLFWIIVPIILFVLYLQKSLWGNYTTFKALLGIIAAIDAMALLAFGDDMKALLPRFEKENNLISKPGSEYDIAELKLILGNITALTTFLTILIPDETTVKSWINNVAAICYKIGFFLNKYFGANNLDAIFSKDLLNDTQFKMIVFMFVIVGLLLLLSWVFFKMEKRLYIKISFK